MKFNFRKKNKKKAGLSREFLDTEISYVDSNARSQIKSGKTVRRTDGFALLFAVIVSVILLAVGSSIISIALKQINLSGTGRDSQFAFYAANTGIECATFWDLNADLNDSTTIFDPFKKGAFVANGAKCGGINNNVINLPESTPESTTATYDIGDGDISYNVIRFRFSVEYGDSNEPCVDVIVNKVMNNAEDEVLKTIIESRGYNRCERNNPRTTQRGLNIRY